jgi:short-subunit dehydrogenase
MGRALVIVWAPIMALPPARDANAALITGASSGIGEEFARQLAARGYNLVLVARRTDRLKALAAQLGPLAVRAEVEVADLQNPDLVQALPARIAEHGLEIDLLVNNAGFGHYGAFAQSKLESEIGQIRVNVEALVTLTHELLPEMIERGRGAIINIASSAGMQPLPYEAVYAASKAFVLSFSEALHAETRGTGVSIVAVNPGPVPTEWQAVAGLVDQPKFPPSVSPQQVVKESLEAADKDKRSIIPGRLVRFSMMTTRPIPNALKLPVIKRINEPTDVR